MAKSALLSVRIVADGKDAAKGLNDVAKGAGALQGSLNKTSSPLSKIQGLLGGVAKFAGNAVKTVAGVGIAVAALAIKGGIAKSLQIENATAKMKGLKHSTETVSKVMDDALASVKGTAFGLGDAANIASTALASGIKPGQEMQKYLTLVADAAATAQVPLGEMGQIMGKVTNSGKVTNEVLQQFGDRGVGALQMLAEHYGVTSAEMTAMVSKGKVDAATFNKVLNDSIGGAAKKSGDTTAGAFANMKSAMANFGIILSGWFFPLVKGVFNQVQFIFEGLTARLKPVSDAFAETFQAKAGPIIANFAKNTLAVLDEIIGGFRAFGAAWKANDGDITSSGFPGFMERVANAARTVQGVFQKLDFSSFDAFIASLSVAGGAAGESLGSIGTSLQTLMPAFQAFMDQLPKISGALVKLGGLSLNVLTTGLSFLADHVDTIIKWMPAIVTGFVAWKIASGATAAASLKVNIAQTAMIPVTTANNILRLIAIRQETQLAAATGTRTAATNATIGATLRAKAAMVASTAASLAQRAALGVATAAQWLFNAAMSANPVMLIVLGIAALIAAVVLAYNNIGWFKDFVDAAFKGIQIVVGVVVEWFKNAWAKSIDAVKIYILAWQIIIAAVIKVVTAIITAVVNWFKDAWNKSVTAVRVIFLAWQLIFAAVIAVIRGIVSGIVAFFQTSWNSAVNGAVGFVIGFRDKVSSIFSAVKSKIDTVVNFVRDGLSGAFQTAARLATGALSTITGAIQGVIGWVKDAISWVGSLFGKTSAAKSNASGLGGATGYVRGPAGDPGFSGGATGLMIRPARFAPSGGGMSPTVVNINLTVNGAIDGDGTAKTILKLLREELRRNGVLLNGVDLW